MPWHKAVGSRVRGIRDAARRHANWAGQHRWAGVTAALLTLVLCQTNGSARAQPLALSSIENRALASSDATTFSTTTISIPTYPYANYLTSGYNATYNMTYPVLDWTRYLAASPTPVPHTYTLLVMENAYLKVTLLPELGGRVYQIIDKATGNNQLYQNPVIKPTRWGPSEQGWWLAVGGIEWCLPVDEHGYESGTPWAWSMISSTAGITVTVQDTTATNRLRAAVAIFLPSDRGYVDLSPRVDNPTGAPVDFKFWINAALAPGAANAPTEGLSFIFSSPEMSVHSTGDTRLPGAYPIMPTAADYRFDWPQYEGVDYSKLRNWNQWLGFFEYPNATKGFVGLYDGLQQEGMVRVFPPETAKGTKAFAMGWSHPLDWHTWTDDGSGYVEFHGGLAPTFWDTTQLAPYSTASWHEVWYPIPDLESISVATEEAALRATKTGDQLELAVKPTRAWAAGTTEVFVWKRATCSELARWTLPAMGPTAIYENGLTVGALTEDEIAVAITDSAHTILAAYGPSDCLNFAMPAAHLGYGANVRELSRMAQLTEPLAFEWVKLWDEYGSFPTSVLPQKVLYSIGCGAYVNDLNAWRSRIRSVAQAGLGKVQAYEICNEPNTRGTGWGDNAPNPVRFTQMVCIARDEIKAVDPYALVVSGGLAPVGRIPSPWSCGEGNNCDAMDEWVYLEAMLDGGAGTCMDTFGYHPYGFASPPERDPDLVSNAFAFRGVEKLHDILVERGLSDLPVWATEFGWIRKPSEDGYELTCDTNTDYQLYFKWQEVTAQTQADYLVRAYKYADTHWPWMQGMVVWNLDWHDYMTALPCLHSRYYALRRYDGTTLGASTPAYTALAAMDKRPWPHGVPVLSVQPARQALISEEDAPTVLTTTFAIDNLGPGTLTWTVGLSPTSSLVPVLSAAGGSQGERLGVTVDTHGLAVGTYTATLRIDAIPAETLGRPKVVDVTLHVVTEFRRVYLPTIMRNFARPATPYTNIPHGPSKIGTHAVAEGGTLDLVRQVHDAGGYVALVNYKFNGRYRSYFVIVLFSEVNFGYIKKFTTYFGLQNVKKKTFKLLLKL